MPDCHVWDRLDTTLPLMVPPVDYIEADLEKGGECEEPGVSPPPPPVIINPDPWDAPELETEGLDSSPAWNGGYNNLSITNLLPTCCVYTELGGE